MKPQYVKFRLMPVVLLLGAILMLFLVTTAASTQDQSDGKLSIIAMDYESSGELLQVVATAETSIPLPNVEIEILNTAPLSYDYEGLAAGLEHIDLLVHNKGKDSANIEWKVLTNLIDKKGNPIVLSFKGAPTVTIKPGDVIIFDLALDPAAIQIDDLLPGQYSGSVVLTDQNGGIKYMPFMLAVPSVSLAPNGVVSYDIVGIDATTPLKVDYQSLLIDTGTIAVAVENKGKQAVHIRGNVVFKNIVNKSGDPLQLNFELDNEPVQVEPGQVVFLNFKLISPTKGADTSPKSSTYDGYVFITAQEDSSVKYAALALSVPNEHVAAAGTYLTFLVEWFQGISRRVSSWLPCVHQELVIGLPGFVVLIFLVGLMIRQISLLTKRGRPGPVILDKITNATGDESLKTGGLDAGMREWMEEVGLRPDEAKPFDAITPAVETLVSAVPVPAGFSLSVVFKSLWGLIFPPRGNEVVNTLWKETNESGQAQYELAFEIKDVQTKCTTMINHGKGGTPQEAVEQANSMIYHHIMMEDKYVCRGTPPWERFSTSKSILLYEQGKHYEKKKEMEKAFKVYMQAASEDPNNVTIRQGIISTQEGRAYLKTLACYLMAVEQWPDLLEMRYRLAVNLTFVKNLVAQWFDVTNNSEKEKLKKLLEKAITDSNKENKNGVFGGLIEDSDGKVLIEELSNKENQDELKVAFLELSLFERYYLESQLRWLTRYKKWLKTFIPYNLQPGVRRYFKLWVFWHPKWIKTPRFSKVERLGKYINLLRLQPYTNKPQGSLKVLMNTRDKKFNHSNQKLDTLEEQVEKIIKPTDSQGENWEVHYTAACFYSLAITDPENGDEKLKKKNEEYAKKAVEHLSQVVRDPDFTKPDWLFEKDGDPDLENLQKRPEYAHWVSIVRPNPTDTLEKVSLSELSENRKPRTTASV